MAVGLRGGALVLHHAHSWWIVVCDMVSESCVLWSPLGMKNGWGCSGFSCEAGRKARGQKDILDLEDHNYIIYPLEKEQK